MCENYCKNSHGSVPCLVLFSTRENLHEVMPSIYLNKLTVPLLPSKRSRGLKRMFVIPHHHAHLRASLMCMVSLLCVGIPHHLDFWPWVWVHCNPFSSQLCNGPIECCCHQQSTLTSFELVYQLDIEIYSSFLFSEFEFSIGSVCVCVSGLLGRHITHCGMAQAA